MKTEQLAQGLPVIREIVQILSHHVLHVLLINVVLWMPLLIHRLRVDVLLDSLNVVARLLDVFNELRAILRSGYFISRSFGMKLSLGASIGGAMLELLCWLDFLGCGMTRSEL